MLRDQMPATRELDGHRRVPLQRCVYVPLGASHRLPQAALRADASGPIRISGATTAAPASIPERLQEQLTLWRHQPPSRYDFHRVEEVFPSASYQYVLYGMGFRPDRRASDATSSTTPDRADSYFREAARARARCWPALPTNRALIGHIQSVTACRRFNAL